MKKMTTSSEPTAKMELFEFMSTIVSVQMSVNEKIQIIPCNWLPELL